MAAESVLIAVAAVTIATLVWAIVAAVAGIPPLAALSGIWIGSFGSIFAFEQTLRAATPLLFTGLCVAIPARAGLVIIGGEGALIIGGLAAAVAATQVPEFLSLPALIVGGMIAGAFWIGICAWLHTARGVNETISSLMLNFVAFALLNHLVEGILRDPSSLDRPATATIPAAAEIGTIFASNVPWGLVVGITLCLAGHLCVTHMTSGLTLRYIGSNPRAASFASLPVTSTAFLAAVLGGAAAGLNGAIEIGTSELRASTNLALGHGYVGILVAALASSNLLALIPCALLVSAFETGSGLLQRRYAAPAASADMLNGLIFLSLVVSSSWRGRLIPILLSRNNSHR